METQEKLNKWKLDLLCNELKTLLDDEVACDRYEKQSRVGNRLESQEPIKYKDIRGFDRYVR